MQDPAPSEAPIIANIPAPLDTAPSNTDSLEVVIAPAASTEVAPPNVAGEEAFTPADATQSSTHTRWLAVTAALGLLGGAGLGLAAMRALSGAPGTPTKPDSLADATLLAPARETTQRVATPAASIANKARPGPTIAPVAAALPQGAPEPPAARSSASIPWDDLPQAATKSCEALAVAGAGPTVLLAGQAVTNAQRAVVRGDTIAAHAAFCTAAQLGATTDTVLLGLARVLFAQSDLAAALGAIDQLLERAPTNKQALDLRGDILVRMGNVEEARKAWFKAVGATRASKLLVENLVRASDADAKIAIRAGDLSRADRMIRRSIALTSGDPEHCRSLIAVLEKNGNEVAAARWRAYLSAVSG